MSTPRSKAEPVPNARPHSQGHAVCDFTSNVNLNTNEGVPPLVAKGTYMSCAGIRGNEQAS
jgi:hypothetical protein